GRRLQLQTILENLMAEINPTILPDPKAGNKYHVYFQPDQNISLSYPAIVYMRDRVDEKRANNILYNYTKRYRITIIDRNPDSKIPDAVSRLPMTSFLGFN